MIITATVRLSLLCSMALLWPLQASAQKEMTHKDVVFDFGHIGIDFEVYHTYRYVNRSNKAVRITDLNVPCDCSRVRRSDSLVQPGDTAFFKLSFSTKDLYGPTSKSFTVHTDDPEVPMIQYFNQAIIGQWFYGLRPNPISVFLLPGKKSKMVTISNHPYARIHLSIIDQFDTSFSTEILKETAKKGEMLELEIAANENIKAGTYSSSLTVAIEKKGEEKPTILTIPVKIVRY